LLLNRLFENVKNQNWMSLSLELLVVVVGIFLAFQVDRWYESRQLRQEEISHLESLSADFTATVKNIEANVLRHRDSIDSAIQLLSLQAGQPTAITPEDFYKLYADLQFARVANYQRSTYDYLISSGQIAILRNEQLRGELTAIFSRIDGDMNFFRADLQDHWRNGLEPYVRQNLDHVAAMHAVHPDADILSVPPTLPDDHLNAVIGTGEFEALVSDKWHLSRDLVVVYGFLVDQIHSAQERISADLNRQ
jgi:hypothetical protein